MAKNFKITESTEFRYFASNPKNKTIPLFEPSTVIKFEIVLSVSQVSLERFKDLLPNPFSGQQNAESSLNTKSLDLTIFVVQVHSKSTLYGTVS